MDHSEIKHLPKVDHTPAELDEPSKLLLKAATIIEQQGLVKHIREYPTCDPAGKHCVLGAIDRAGGHDPEGWDSDKGDAWKQAVLRLERALGGGGDETNPGFIAARWNNEPVRAGYEVVAKLRAVALGL